MLRNIWIRLRREFDALVFDCRCFLSIEFDVEAVVENDVIAALGRNVKVDNFRKPIEHRPKHETVAEAVIENVMVRDWSLRPSPIGDCSAGLSFGRFESFLFHQ